MPRRILADFRHTFGVRRGNDFENNVDNDHVNRIITK